MSTGQRRNSIQILKRQAFQLEESSEKSISEFAVHKTVTGSPLEKHFK